MEASKAREILQALLDGVDPESGELMPDDSVFCEPNVIRALHHAILAMTEQTDVSAAAEEGRKDKRDKPKPGNAGKAWSPEEEGLLVEMYESGVSVTEIARRLERSRTSIRARLVRVGMFASRRDVPERRKFTNTGEE